MSCVDVGVVLCCVVFGFVVWFLVSSRCVVLFRVHVRVRVGVGVGVGVVLYYVVLSCLILGCVVLCCVEMCFVVWACFVLCGVVSWCVSVVLC